MVLICTYLHVRMHACTWTYIYIHVPAAGRVTFVYASYTVNAVQVCTRYLHGHGFGHVRCAYVYMHVEFMHAWFALSSMCVEVGGHAVRYSPLSAWLVRTGCTCVYVCIWTVGGMAWMEVYLVCMVCGSGIEVGDEDRDGRGVGV